MTVRINGGTLVDPGVMDGPGDIIIRDGKIAAVLKPGEPYSDEIDEIIDASGKIIVPGLIDLHVHLREPGHEYKETIETGLRAACHGGFTAVCCMPNTKPVNDNSQVTDFIVKQGEKLGLARVYPVGAVSLGLKGENLSEFGDMKKAGIVGVTDDGRPVENARLLRRAMEYASGLDLVVMCHSEDLALAKDGSMNEGSTATQLGIKGIPNAAESTCVMRDIAVAELVGCQVHLAHISCRESVDVIREAKKRGVRVTAETAPHYFTLTDDAVRGYNTHAKMNPPLRTEEDRQAIIRGLADGTIDCIATDHAPHSSLEKDVEFDRAAFGIIGLETALGLSLGLVQTGVLTLGGLVEKLSKNPAKVLGINNDIIPGNPADLTLIDPDVTWTVDPDAFASKSRNTPFGGFELTGLCHMTMVNGKVVFRRAAP